MLKHLRRALLGLSIVAWISLPALLSAARPGAMVIALVFLLGCDVLLVALGRHHGR